MVSNAFFLYGTILVGLSVGLLSSTILIFGPRILDDLSSSRNWSPEKIQQINRNMFKLSAVLIVFLTAVIVENHLGPL
jgi:hypothetical protein